MNKTAGSFLRWTLLGACLWAAGCANLTSFPPGTPAATIESSRGKPFRVWPEPNGAASWEYPMGPSGRHTYMVRVGADGRVTRVDQVLAWPFFHQLKPGMTTREVEQTLGRPYNKEFMYFQNENVWAWRWLEAVWYRCFFAHFSPEGTLRRVSAGDENTADMGLISSAPC